MKSYNRILIAAVLIYLAAALTAGLGIARLGTEENQYYKVEINRITDSLSAEHTPDRLSLDSCRYIENVTFLEAGNLEDQEKMTLFYQEENDLRMDIRPWYEGEQFMGFLRFDYREPVYDRKQALLIAELGLGTMGAFLILLLLYLKYRLILPFHRMSEMPGELAKGHLKSEVREEKNRFFGRFLWGIGQLKDTLEASRKRRLQLEKEKKLLLLSLSHDIKTPLNTIRLYGKALEEDVYDLEEQNKHAARQIWEKTGEIEQYVEEIMKNSREDLLDIQVKEGEFYLADLLKRIADTYEEKCGIRMLALQVEAYENRLLKGDLDRALEVFENLFENAFKYGDGRWIHISFYEEDYCQLVRFSNSGTPVTDQELNHIFESFFRGSNSSGKQGNGLGLYICREIMRKMDGEIFAEKEEDGMALVLVFR